MLTKKPLFLSAVLVNDNEKIEIGIEIIKQSFVLPVYCK